MEQIAGSDGLAVHSGAVRCELQLSGVIVPLLILGRVKMHKQ